MAAFAWDAKREHKSFIIHACAVCVHLFLVEFRLFFKDWFLLKLSKSDIFVALLVAICPKLPREVCGVLR